MTALATLEQDNCSLAEISSPKRKVGHGRSKGACLAWAYLHAGPGMVGTMG